jgi:hypothetical protein
MVEKTKLNFLDTFNNKKLNLNSSKNLFKKVADKDKVLVVDIIDLDEERKLNEMIPESGNKEISDSPIDNLKTNLKIKSYETPKKRYSTLDYLRERNKLVNLANSSIPQALQSEVKSISELNNEFQKNETNVEVVNQKSVQKPPERIRQFKIEYIPNWYAKNHIPEYKIPLNMAGDIDFQMNTINDEIKVVIDNIQNLRMLYLNNPSLSIIFKSLERKHQIKLNTLLEESTTLMLEISNKILIDFAQYLEKFVSIQPPRPEKFSKSVVKHEDKAFLINIQIFNEVTIFLKSCHEVYLTLFKQVEDMIIPSNEFVKVVQFLNRLRLNLSNLIFSCKNYFKNFANDRKLLNKFLTNREEIVLQTVETDNNEPETQKLLAPNKAKSISLAEKMSSQYQPKINEENERKRRLNTILSK